MAPPVEHNEVFLAIGKNERDEHLEEISPEILSAVREKPLNVKAFAPDDPNAPPLSNSNVKISHWIRHGQGFHNLMAEMARAQGRVWKNNTNTPENPYTMPEILDAPLTHKGREQAILLQSTVRALKDKPELVVFSPNCRALQTGMLAFQELDEKVPFIAHECVREETGVHMCDKRRPKSQQAKEFPRIDFSELETEHDAIFDENVRETKLQLVNRIYKFLEWLEARDEKHVGVSSHSAFLLTLFNANLVSDDDKLKDWFQTGEMRSAVLEFVRT